MSFSFLIKDKRQYVTMNGQASKLSKEEKIPFWYEKSDGHWYLNGPKSVQYQVFKVDINSLSVYSPKLKYLFETDDDNHNDGIVFAQDPLTSTPVVMKRDKDNQWMIENSK